MLKYFARAVAIAVICAPMAAEATNKASSTGITNGGGNATNSASAQGLQNGQGVGLRSPKSKSKNPAGN